MNIRGRFIKIFYGHKIGGKFNDFMINVNRKK